MNRQYWYVGKNYEYLINYFTLRIMNYRKQKRMNNERMLKIKLSNGITRKSSKRIRGQQFGGVMNI